MIRSGPLSNILTILLWVPIVFFSVLLSHNAVLYFTHGGEYGILPEKLDALKDIIWRIAFYVHLPAGVLCLFTPLIPFVFIWFKKNIGLHQLVGKIYVWTTLWVVCPTGLYLAIYAKGGWITQIGFVVQGILLWYFTWKGLKEIKNRNRASHADNMMRSYATALVVLTFRIYHILFFIWKVPYQDNYAMSQWLGLLGNLWMVECLILYRSKKLNQTKSI